jgi:fibronectin type 3 domain-containing protein
VDKVKKITIMIFMIFFSFLLIQHIAHAAPNDVRTGVISENPEKVTIDPTVTNPGNAIDKDSATYATFPKWTKLEIHFDNPVAINEFYISYSGWDGSAAFLYFYDSSGKQIFFQRPYSGTGYQKISVVQNVSRIMLRFETGYSTNLKEFEVYAVQPPPDVTQIVTVPFENKMEISWTNPTDANFTGVEIYRNDAKIATAAKPQTKYTDTGLTPDTQYKYRIVALYNGGNTSLGVVFYARTLERDETPPAEIRNLKSYVYADRIKFTWDNPPDIDFYEVRIYRDGKQIATAVTPANQFTDYDLQEHTTYTFVFHSVDTSGNVSEGVSVTETTKGRPRGKIMGFMGEAWENSVELYWYAHSEATKYFVYQDGLKIGETTENKYTVSGLENGRNYFFSVAPVNEWGEGERSQEIQLTPVEIPIPSTPTDLRASATNTTITLTWSKVNYARKYRIYQISSGDEVLVGETTSTSYTVGNLSPGTAYQLYVSAVNEKGESEKAMVRVTTATKPIPDDFSTGLTPWEVIQNTIILVGSLASLILLSLVFYFSPRIIQLIKSAAE